MKRQNLFATLFAICGVAIGAGAIWSHPGGDYCPNPSAASVTALFAPCQAFDSAMGREVTRQEAVQMGLLIPAQRPTSETQFALNRGDKEIR
jgi:hypothetical protein